MIFTAQQNQTDSDMIEFYYEFGDSTYLACVMHGDCLIGSGLMDMINEKGSIKVKMEVVE